jgi:general stress protein CsbA
MARKVYVKPPQPTRTMLWTQIIIAALFLPFGVVLLTTAEGEARPFALIFLVIWVVACIAIVVNAVKWLSLIQKGSIEVGEITGADGETEGGFAVKLRELEALKKEGLITESEYQRKRAEIIQEKW